MKSNILKESKMVGTPTIVSPVALSGYVSGWHYCAETKLWEKAFSGLNTISDELKAIVRDNMNAPADFALDNYFATDGQKYGGGGHAAGDPAGFDGIVVLDTTNTYWLTLITIVHPSDASGNYYRQWQGKLINNLGAGVFNIGEGGGAFDALIGVNLDGANTFVYDFASKVIATAIVMQVNDILTINWKIVVG